LAAPGKSGDMDTGWLNELEGRQPNVARVVAVEVLVGGWGLVFYPFRLTARGESRTWHGVRREVTVKCDLASTIISQGTNEGPSMRI
jgi:hypothetical protein